MDRTVFIVNKFLAGLTLLSDIGLVVFLVIFLVSRKIPFYRFVKKYAFHFALIVAATAMLGSLFYSEIAKYTPCLLCWYQRILMYPQTLLLSMAIVKKDKHIADYLLVMSGLGLLIALYHYYIQRGGQTILPCSAVGYSQECSQNFGMEYGFVTIPLMAATAFLLIIILMVLAKSKGKKN